MQRVKSLLASIVVLGILAGVPVLLVQLATIPGFLPSWVQLRQRLFAPDDGSVFLVLVWVAAWLVWLVLIWLIVSEVPAAIRSIRSPTLVLPAISLPRSMARQLLVSAMLLFITAPTALQSAHATPAATPAGSQARPITAPASPAPSQPTRIVEDGTTQVVVERGDTLWDLSQQHLGDATRWPEIYETNRGVEQPDGRRLEDPDQIDIGWVLTIPHQTPVDDTAPPPPRPPSQSAEDAVTDREEREEPAESATDSTAGSGVRAETMTAPQPRRVPTQQTPQRETDVLVEDTDEEEIAGEVGELWWQVPGLLGAGAFLGAGIFWALTQRRREQFRTRPAGTVIAEPDPTVVPIERTARSADGASARLLNRVDGVLRRLSRPGWVPPISAVGVARDGALLLHTIAALDDPWQQTPQGWLLPGHISPDDLGSVHPDRPAPYPLLVTVGADDQATVWLLNLETIGIVGVTGDPVMVPDFLRYIAAELAVNPWAADVRVACHGAAEAVVPMAPDRLNATLEQVTQIATTITNRSLDEGATAAEGRLDQLGDEVWHAAALITNHDNAGQLIALVELHPQRTGTAVVISSDDGELQLTPTGRLRGLGLDLVVVGLTEDEAAGCAALLASFTDAQPQPPAPADDFVDDLGHVLPEHHLDRDDDAADGESLLPQPSHEYLEAAVITEPELQRLAPKLHSDVALELIERDPHLDAQVEMWFSDHCPLPRLSLLGPVLARCHGRPPAKQKALYTEILAYLALHPGGVTADQLATALDTTVARTRNLISTLRTWVGKNPNTNKMHIPDAKDSPQAKARGTGLYLVEGLLLDIDLFRRLRARGTARGPVGIHDLEAALRLVQGHPFDQLRPAGWGWLIEGDRTDHHMICAISDVAHTIVTHYLHAGAIDQAEDAARIGLIADPDSETARMDLAGVMVARGNSKSARDIVANALGDKADEDITDRTAEILARRGWDRLD